MAIFSCFIVPRFGGTLFRGVTGFFADGLLDIEEVLLEVLSWVGEAFLGGPDFFPSPLDIGLSGPPGDLGLVGDLEAQTVPGVLITDGLGFDLPDFLRSSNSGLGELTVINGVSCSFL